VSGVERRAYFKFSVRVPEQRGSAARSGLDPLRVSQLASFRRYPRLARDDSLSQNLFSRARSRSCLTRRPRHATRRLGVSKTNPDIVFCFFFFLTINRFMRQHLNTVAPDGMKEKRFVCLLQNIIVFEKFVTRCFR
jgi:hypothetical protein